MKMRKTLSLCLAAGLAVSSSLALAQGGPPGQQPGGPHGGPPGHGPQKGHHGGPPPRAQGGPGEDSWQHPDWRKGDRVPQQYRDAQYRVDDYRQYHLDPPKRGHHWVGVGGDFLQVDGAGLIIQIVPGR